MVVELEIDTTLAGPTANSYVSLDDAQLYAAERVGGDQFLLRSDQQQIRALITAAREIDVLGDEFIGSRSTTTQALEWPRDLGTLPTNLVRAQIELAISYAPALETGNTGDPLNPSLADGNVKRIQVGPIEKEWFGPRTTEATAFERFPASVQRLLASLLRVPVTGWGSATVVRGS